MTEIPSLPFDFDGDALIAGVDLVGRSGAGEVELGWTKDDVPIEEADWYAVATYRGTKIIVEHYRGPVEAVEALARRLLRGGTCRRCGEPIVLAGAKVLRGCHWTRHGDRWVAGCGQEIDRSIPVPPHVRGGS